MEGLKDAEDGAGLLWPEAVVVSGLGVNPGPPGLPELGSGWVRGIKVGDGKADQKTLLG